MKYLALLVAGALMVPFAARATDGDRLSASSVAAVAAEKSSNNYGTTQIERFLLCDGDPGTGKTCAAFDTQRLGLGNPSRADFVFISGPSCTASDTVAPSGSDTSNLATKYTLGPTGSTTIVTGGQMIVQPVVNRYLTADIVDGDNSCTDAEVILQLYYDKSDVGGR